MIYLCFCVEFNVFDFVCVGFCVVCGCVWCVCGWCGDGCCVCVVEDEGGVGFVVRNVLEGGGVCGVSVGGGDEWNGGGVFGSVWCVLCVWCVKC